MCIGKGNDKWNQSAPHGAGRLMSRSAAMHRLSLEQFQKEMEGVYTTCVGYNTLDESPMAYKDVQQIVTQIGKTVHISKQIMPIYNFKAEE